MSSPYIVSARKYRPSTFASVVGQMALTRTLKNAIDSGRLAQAYLFCGPRGVGKTSCARIFAKTINCEHRTAEGEACGQCDSCLDFERGVSYNVIELDAASNNGVENMRSLTEQVNVPPVSGRYRVFIIDEVHMLSTGAFNAFLKTLEEPPAYAIFILATTEKNKVLPTILSRCQTYDFARITERDIALQLQRIAEAEGIPVEQNALEVIARKADGAMRDALSIFDQVAAAGGGRVTYAVTIENLNVLDYDVYFRFTDAFAGGNVEKALLLFRDVRDAGFDSRFFIAGLAGHIRNLLVAQSPATVSLIEVGDEVAQRYAATASVFDSQWYYRALELLQECDLNFREATDKQLLVELVLIRLSCLRSKEQVAVTSGAGSEPIGALSRSASSGSTSTPLSDKASSSAAPVVSESSPKAERPVATSTPTPPVASPPRVAPPVRPRSGARQGRSLRISAVAQKTASQQQSAEQPDAAPPLPATSGEADTALLSEAWQEYITANSDKKLLLTAMRRMQPVSLGQGRYELMVDNKAQLLEAENNLASLAQYLREKTGFASLTLSVREQAPTERPRHLSPAETLADMVKRSRDTAKLLELLDAEQI